MDEREDASQRLRDLKRWATDLQLGWKILGIIVPLITIPTLVLGLLAYAKSRAAIEEQVNQLLVTQMSGAGRMVDTTYEMVTRSLEDELATFAFIVESAGTARIDEGELRLTADDSVLVVNGDMSLVDRAAAMSGLPAVFLGPILRRVTPDRFVAQLAVRAPADVALTLMPESAPAQTMTLKPGDDGLRVLAAGARLFYLLIDVAVPDRLPTGRWIDYRIALRLADDPSGAWVDHSDWAPDIAYPGRATPGFRLCARVGALLHGSCRKPHHPSGDGLAAADRLLAEKRTAGAPGADWPALLAMTGDQVYLDDVAGPMLRAIHRVIGALGLPEERFDTIENTVLNGADELYAHKHGYYRREALLPRTEDRRAVWEVVFAGVRKPVFTADAAHNHVMTLAETLAMYLLVWSPALWDGLDLTPPPGLAPEHAKRYAAEAPAIARFVEDLPAVRRLLAHIPTAMIFDDHDVTDDWNLNRDWEETAYENPFSRRVIGNALIGYLIHQGWGNAPENFGDDLFAQVEAALAAPGSDAHDRAIDTLVDLEAWDYQWPTEPPLVVLDTRTRRWRSETNGQKPSGLLDWEAVTDFQRAIRDREAVIVVSAAPIFGVKLIETIQRAFTFIGKPLMVDAEYWMAHPGTAEAVLNVFRHRKTPDRFTILSGDVHYSFVYDVELRGRRRGPDIWQICSSGLRNEFPDRLLDTLDRLNRWIFAPRSPLNWFTKRRHMRVIPRKPQGTPSGRRLLNGSGVGVVTFDEAGAPIRIEQALAAGGAAPFLRRDEEARWD